MNAWKPKREAGFYMGQREEDYRAEINWGKTEGGILMQTAVLGHTMPLALWWHQWIMQKTPPHLITLSFFCSASYGLYSFERWKKVVKVKTAKSFISAIWKCCWLTNTCEFDKVWTKEQILFNSMVFNLFKPYFKLMCMSPPNLFNAFWSCFIFICNISFLCSLQTSRYILNVYFWSFLMIVTYSYWKFKSYKLSMQQG